MAIMGQIHRLAVPLDCLGLTLAVAPAVLELLQVPTSSKCPHASEASESEVVMHDTPCVMQGNIALQLNSTQPCLHWTVNRDPATNEGCQPQCGT